MSILTTRDYEETDLGVILTWTRYLEDSELIQRQQVVTFERVPPNLEPIVVRVEDESPYNGIADYITTYTYDERFPLASLPLTVTTTLPDGKPYSEQVSTYDEGGTSLRSG